MRYWRLRSELLVSADETRRVGVCFLVDDVQPDAGTERQIEATVRCLPPAEFDVHVCCFRDSERLRRLGTYTTATVFPFRQVYSARALWQMWRFRRYLQRHKIHVVHSWMVTSTLFGVPAAAGSGSRIVTSRLNTGYWYTPFLIVIFRALNRFTDRIFANSEGAKKIAVAAEKLNPAKFDIIYNGVDMNRYSPHGGNAAAAAALGIPEGTRVVGIVANLRPVKDIPLFLRAAAIVANRVSDTAFLVVGQGELRDELGTLAAELGIADKVFFSEGRGEVADYLPRMSIACLSSRSEGFSNAILEYMAAGLPVIATDVGGNSEAIAEGETGYLVRDRTPEAFAEPVIRLLECEDLRAAMGRRARERCHSLFSIEVYGERMRQFYRSFAR